MDAALAAVVAEHFDLQIVSATPVAGLGDECEIWKTVEPGGFAVRVSPRWRLAADLEWVYGVASVFAACVPGARAPVLGVDGRSVAVWDGRPVSGRCGRGCRPHRRDGVDDEYTASEVRAFWGLRGRDIGG
jgi:hypothetical protein